MSTPIIQILDTIRKGVEFVEGLSPVIALIPGAGPILATAVSAAGAVTEVVTNLKTRLDERTVVMNSSDEAELQALINRLDAVNDELAKRVDES